MNKIAVFIIGIAHILSFAATSHAEYIRATNEEEIILVSTESEVKMGKSLAKKTEERFGLYEDVYLQKRIDGIGQKIAAVCDRRDILYTFKVLTGKELKPEQKINAFALPCHGPIQALENGQVGFPVL